jgi:outer membrane protein assembly factor BamB
MGSKRAILAGCALIAALSALMHAQPRATADWPQWRGPNRDGSAPSFRVPKAWPVQLTQKWKVDEGPGYATPVLIGNRVYAFSRKGENETLEALDADSGKVVWAKSYAAPYTLVPAAGPHGMGPKSTPVFADGRIFTFGISGILTAFDANTGAQLWQKPAPEVGPTFSTSMSPIVDRGLLIAHVGGNNKGALTAFEPTTGAIKWHWDGDGPSYGSPIVADLGGTRQVVTFTQANLVSVSEETGELLWQRPFKTPAVTNSQTPLIYNGDTLIITDAENGVAAFKVAKQQGQWAVQELWKNEENWLRLSGGIIVRDALFGLSPQNRGQFLFMDLKTGKRLSVSEPRAADNAAILKSGNLLIVLKANGELVFVDGAKTDAFTPIKTYKVSDTPTWGQPAVSGNRIFVKNESSLTLFTVD